MKPESQLTIAVCDDQQEARDLAQDCAAEVLDPTPPEEELPGLALRLALRSYADKLACQRVLSLLAPREEKAERKKK